MLSRIKALIVLLLWLPGISQAALNVFACEPEWAALAEAIGGDRLKIYSATAYMQDPHLIQARPSLIAKTRRADLLICTGADLEIGWLPLLLRKAGNSKIQPGTAAHFLAADYIEMLEVPVKLDRSLGDIHAEGNPHIHTDPNNLLMVASALHERLIEIDPGNADHYRRQYGQFASAWEQRIDEWNKATAGWRGRQIVTHHTFWSYLFNWTGLDTVVVLEPVPGVPPTSSHLAGIQKQITGKDIAMIVKTTYVSDRSAQWLSSRSGIPVVELDATVDFQGGETLEQWFDEIVSTINASMK